MITSGHQLLSAWTSCLNHRHKSYTTIHAQSCQPDTERHSASSCHVCWDAVFCTYFVLIECVDWNKFVWIQVLFLGNQNISYLLYLSRTRMHFGDMKQMPNIVSLHHFHHFLCACRSQEEFTDSNVSCRVTSKHFTSEFLLYFIFCYIFYTVIICKVYIYIHSVANLAILLLNLATFRLPLATFSFQST